MQSSAVSVVQKRNVKGQEYEIGQKDDTVLLLSVRSADKEASS